MSALLEFLSRNSIEQCEPLPLVHTSAAYFLKQILREKKLSATPCSVFKGEDLLYFFVGRPAYKKEIELEARYWELPCCFILEYEVIGARHIYPFDTGAFVNGLYPNFVSLADLREYNVSTDILA